MMSEEGRLFFLMTPFQWVLFMGTVVFVWWVEARIKR